MRSIDRVRDAYGAAVARLVRFSIIGLAMVAVAMAGIGRALAKITPTGFLPEDDQGALVRRRAIARRIVGRADRLKSSQRAEAILKEEEAVARRHLGRSD